MTANQASKQPQQPPDEPAILNTVERLKALADPIRIRFMLELTEGPRTVKEVAEALGVPPTRLYYHLRILEQNGLLEVANRRIVSGIEERSYRITGDPHNMNVAPTLTASQLYESGALRALFDVVRSEIEVAVETEPDLSMEDPLTSPILAMAITEFVLSREELAELVEAFGEFLGQYADRPRDPSRDRYHFFYAMYPLPKSPEPPREDES